VARILLIDDDGGVRRTVRRLLERAGHAVLEAGDGQEGLRLHREWRPDLIIADIFMPQVDGLELILQLRREAAAVPIVILSGGDGSGTPDLRKEAALLGAARVLSKPCAPDDLIGIVTRLLPQSGSPALVERAPPEG